MKRELLPGEIAPFVRIPLVEFCREREAWWFHDFWSQVAIAALLAVLARRPRDFDLCGLLT
jgi:hypothetical protein